MLEHRRQTTPEMVKRLLRQESGFGCCFCGHPFIEYHHIVPYAEDAHFRVGDMMTVCPTCHYTCTVGAIPVADQRKAKARPKNVVDGMMRGHLFVTSNELRVQFGGGLAINTERLLTFRGTEMVTARRAEDGRVLISAIILTPEGIPAAHLKNNEWHVIPDSLWDFEVKPRWASARHGPGNLAFVIDCRDDRVRILGQWNLGGLIARFSARNCQIGNAFYPSVIADHCAGLFTVD